MKIIEWFEVQVGRFTNFLSDAKEDLVAFDEHVQNEIHERMVNHRSIHRLALVTHGGHGTRVDRLADPLQSCFEQQSDSADLQSTAR